MRPVAVRARWRFADKVASLLLCGQYAAEIERYDPLSRVVRFYDASVKGGGLVCRPQATAAARV